MRQVSAAVRNGSAKAATAVLSMSPAAKFLLSAAYTARASAAVKTDTEATSLSPAARSPLPQENKAPVSAAVKTDTAVM